MAVIADPETVVVVLIAFALGVTVDRLIHYHRRLKKAKRERSHE